MVTQDTRTAPQSSRSSFSNMNASQQNRSSRHGPPSFSPRIRSRSDLAASSASSALVLGLEGSVSNRSERSRSNSSTSSAVPRASILARSSGFNGAMISTSYRETFARIRSTR